MQTRQCPSASTDCTLDLGFERPMTECVLERFARFKERAEGFACLNKTDVVGEEVKGSLRSVVCVTDRLTLPCSLLGAVPGPSAGLQLPLHIDNLRRQWLQHEALLLECQQPGKWICGGSLLVVVLMVVRLDPLVLM
jgi:hypothetical protein